MPRFRVQTVTIVVGCLLCLAFVYFIRNISYNATQYTYVHRTNAIENAQHDLKTRDYTSAGSRGDSQDTRARNHKVTQDKDVGNRKEGQDSSAGSRAESPGNSAGTAGADEEDNWEISDKGSGVYELPRLIMANTSLCTGRVDLLIYIQSQWGNFLKRRVIRNSWAGTRTFKDINVRTVFILGRPDDQTDQVKINNEQLLHGDIVEGNFVDSYQNLTIKSMIAVDWISRYCLKTRFVLKSDDDMFVNIFSVLERLTTKMNYRKNILACHVVEEGTSAIMRDKNSKWYIPAAIFPNRTTLPRFCSGYTVVTTINMVHALYNASLTAPLITVDDVYLFGQLTSDIPGISFVDLRKNLTLSQDVGLASYRKQNSSDYIAVSASESWVMEELWSLALLKMSSWAKRHSV